MIESQPAPELVNLQPIREPSSGQSRETMLTRGRKRLSEVSETTAVDEDAPSPKKTKLAQSQVATGAADVSEPEQRVARQPVYTVKICDEVFRLSQSQILFEDPSYFSMAFSDD